VLLKWEVQVLYYSSTPALGLSTALIECSYLFNVLHYENKCDVSTSTVRTINVHYSYYSTTRTSYSTVELYYYSYCTTVATIVQ
jgi:hypothetical protein